MTDAVPELYAEQHTTIRARLDLSAMIRNSIIVWTPILWFEGVRIYGGVKSGEPEELFRLYAEGAPTHVIPGGMWLPLPGTNLQTKLPEHAEPGEFLLRVRLDV